MSNHLITMQMVADRQAAAMDTARRHQLAAEARPGRRWRRWTHRNETAGSQAGTGGELMVFARTRTTIPRPGTDAFAAWASTFGDEVARVGIGGVEAQTAALCAVARRHDVSPTCAAVATDRDQADVARERAVGCLLVALAAWAPGRTAASDVA